MWICIWIFNLVVDSQSVSLIKVGEAERREFVKRLIKAEIEFEFLRQIQIQNIWINTPGSSCRVLACIYFRTTRALKSSFFVADISHYSSLKIKIKDFSETQGGKTLLNLCAEQIWPRTPIQNWEDVKLTLSTMWKLLRHFCFFLHLASYSMALEYWIAHKWHNGANNVLGLSGWKCPFAVRRRVSMSWTKKCLGK